MPEYDKLFVQAPKVWLDWWHKEVDKTSDESAIMEPVWVGDMTLYGRRVASKRVVKDFWETEGLQQCPAQPQIFNHFQKDVNVEVHQDDFHDAGDEERSIELKGAVQVRLMIKVTKLLTAVMKYKYSICTRYLLENGTLVVPGEKHVGYHMSHCMSAPTPWDEEATADTSPHLDDEGRGINQTTNLELTRRIQCG